jgi:hypothetical protein
MIRAQRARSVAARQLQPHQVAIGCLVQGIVPQQTLSVGDGLIETALPLSLLDQPFERALAGLPQALALACDPVVIAGGQQFAAIQGDSVNEAISRQCLLKVDHVDRAGRVAAPLHRLSVDGEALIGVRQRFTQSGNQGAEVSAGLRVGGVRPEGDGQLLTGQRLIPAQHEIRQERLQSLRLQPGDRLVNSADLKTAEQLNTQHGWAAQGGMAVIVTDQDRASIAKFTKCALRNGMK